PPLLQSGTHAISLQERTPVASSLDSVAPSDPGWIAGLVCYLDGGTTKAQRTRAREVEPGPLDDFPNRGLSRSPVALQGRARLLQREARRCLAPRALSRQRTAVRRGAGRRPVLVCQQGRCPARPLLRSAQGTQDDSSPSGGEGGRGCLRTGVSP